MIASNAWRILLSTDGLDTIEGICGCLTIYAGGRLFGKDGCQAIERPADLLSFTVMLREAAVKISFLVLPLILSISHLVVAQQIGAAAASASRRGRMILSGKNQRLSRTAKSIPTGCGSKLIRGQQWRGPIERALRSTNWIRTSVTSWWYSAQMANQSNPSDSGFRTIKAPNCA